MRRGGPRSIGLPCGEILGPLFFFPDALTIRVRWISAVFLLWLISSSRVQRHRRGVNFMWCRSYRNHVIMAFPSFDTATGLWAPQANISWIVGTTRQSDFVRFPKRVFTEEEAVASALTSARAWVNNRLRSSPGVAQPETHSERTIRTVASQWMRRGDRAASPRGAKASQNTKILSFDRFKSLMGKSGWNSSADSLHKSYAALLQLSKQDRRSWAEIHVKLRGCQPIRSAAHTPTTKPARLPVTMRDWRRII